MLDATVLIVDDEELIRRSLRERLKEEGYEPDTDGLSVLRELKKLDPDVLVILLTFLVSVDTAVESRKLGAFHFANKPFNVDEVAASVARALETTRLRREVKQLRGERTAALHPARHCRRVPGDGGVAVLENAHACTVEIADRGAGFGGQDPEQFHVSGGG